MWTAALPVPASHNFTVSHHPWALGMEEKGAEKIKMTSRKVTVFLVWHNFSPKPFSPFPLNNPCFNYHQESLSPLNIFSTCEPHLAQPETENEQNEGLANNLQTSSNLWKMTEETP